MLRFKKYQWPTSFFYFRKNISGHIIAYFQHFLSFFLNYLIITFPLTFFLLIFLSSHYFILKHCNSSPLSSSFYLNSSFTHFIYYKNLLYFLFHSMHILPSQKCKYPLYFFFYGFLIIILHLYFRLINFCVELYFRLVRFDWVLICCLFSFL